LIGEKGIALPDCGLFRTGKGSKNKAAEAVTMVADSAALARCEGYRATPPLSAPGAAGTADRAEEFPSGRPRFCPTIEGFEDRVVPAAAVDLGPAREG
jgi:hypothetical protein